MLEPTPNTEVPLNQSFALPLISKVLQSSTMPPEVVEDRSILEGNQALQVMAELAMEQVGENLSDQQFGLSEQMGRYYTRYTTIDLSGAGQGSAPKPPTKIKGGQWRQRQEQVKQIPPPQKIKITPPKPEQRKPWLPTIKIPFITPKKPEENN